MVPGLSDTQLIDTTEGKLLFTWTVQRRISIDGSGVSQRIAAVISSHPNFTVFLKEPGCLEFFGIWTERRLVG